MQKYLSWFFGTIKRTEAEELLLREENENGSYLVRLSENHAGEKIF